MPARKRRSPPLVTIDCDVWRELVYACAAKDVEQWGFLCGRRTRELPVCFKITRMVPLPTLASTSSSATRDLPLARAVENHIRLSPRYDNPVGSWHSHVYDERCAASIIPQLSDVDKRAMSDDTVMLLCSVYPRPDGPILCGNEFTLRLAVDRKVIRAEAWLRVGSKFKPCEVKVR